LGEEGGQKIPNTQKTNNSIEDLMGNKENEYPVPDPNKTLINITNELINVHIKKKKTLKEIMDKNTEKLMEKL
jgi:hypothetical protein